MGGEAPSERQRGGEELTRADGMEGGSQEGRDHLKCKGIK